MRWNAAWKPTNGFAWRRRKATHPRMFNGVVQLLAGARLVDGHLEGWLVTTDYKSFLHWKDHGYRDDSVRDAFGSALLITPLESRFRRQVSRRISSEAMKS